MLGLLSLQAMEQGRGLFLLLWRNPAGSSLLYGSILTHFGLALYSVYRRRSLRMPAWEALQLVLGLLIPPLLFAHVVGTAGANRFAGTEDSYALVLYILWVVEPLYALRQATVLVIAWVHGCMGLHFWLRIRPGYPRWLPLLYTAALLVPVLALLGFIQAGRTVMELAQYPASIEALTVAARRPTGETAQMLGDTVDRLLLIYLAILAGALLIRALRAAINNRNGVVVSYPADRRVTVQRGTTVLEASRIAGIPHASVCGGRGRCSTCRVRVWKGLETLPAPGDQESGVLARIGAPENMRLACQTRPVAAISVAPLLPPGSGALRAARRQQPSRQGHEREVAVLFTDLRGFTQLSERQLPYDVVFLLNRYFAAVGSAVVEADGRIDKFIGDGVMAVFGVAKPIADGCRRALTAAGNIAVQMEKLNERLIEEGLEPLRIGIGVHAGPAIVGEMGYGEAASITVIGDTVNTASRLESLTKDFNCQLVVSDVVADYAGIELPGECRQVATISGRSEPLAVHAIDDARPLAG
jgi:adenylate cyclase